MAPLSVRFTALGHGRVNLATAPLIAAVTEYMIAHVRAVRDEVEPYPEKPPNSKYQRIETLGRSWRIVPAQRGSDLSVQLVNVADDYRRGRYYARYVQGNDQVWYHAATGWKRIADYTRRPEYARGLREVIRRFRIE